MAGVHGQDVHSCMYCERAVVESPISGRALWHTDDRDPDGEWVKVILCREPQEAFKAAKNGCLLFETLLGEHTEANIGHDTVLRGLVLFMFATVDPLHFNSSVHVDWTSSVDLAQPYSNNEEVEHKRAGAFESFAEENNPAGRYLERRPVNRDVASAESSRKACDWIHMCHTKHKAPFHSCPVSIPSLLPTRLIDVQSCGDTVKLYIPARKRDGKSKKRGHYAALTYCWGKKQTLTLNKDNRQAWILGVPVIDLPQTLKDAFTTTRALGLRYIWIDSLCIVQDDPTDVAMEIAHMADIYKRAYVTISAASATSCQEGFLGVREVSSAHRQAFQLPLRCPDGQMGSIKFVREDDEHDIEREPIHQRAWTLQEALLSPRMLVYDSRQLRWVCRSSIDSNEWYTRDGPSSERLELLERKRYPINWTPKEWSLLCWSTVVKTYTSRAMSNDGDKLLAISGIAQVFADTMDDKYLAGLWVSNLPLDLLWVRNSAYILKSTGSHADDLQLRSRPAEYRAPSFSWASVDGTVKRIRISENCRVRVKVLDYRVDLVAEAALYGATRDGFISLQGPLTQALWFDEIYLKLGDNDAAVFPGAVPDTVEVAEGVNSGRSTLVWCLEIASGSGGVPRSAGLVLVTTPDGYRRVGAFDMMFLPWTGVVRKKEEAWRRHFDNCDPQQVVIT